MEYSKCKKTQLKLGMADQIQASGGLKQPENNAVMVSFRLNLNDCENRVNDKVKYASFKQVNPGQCQPGED